MRHSTKSFLYSVLALLIAPFSAMSDPSSSAPFASSAPSPFRDLVLHHNPVRIIIDDYWPYKLCYAYISDFQSLSGYVVAVQGLPGPKRVVRVYSPAVGAEVAKIPNHLRKKLTQSERELTEESFNIIHHYVLARLVQVRWGSSILSTGIDAPTQFLAASQTGIGTVRAFTIDSDFNTESAGLFAFGSHLKEFAEQQISEEELVLYIKKSAHDLDARLSEEPAKGVRRSSGD